MQGRPGSSGPPSGQVRRARAGKIGCRCHGRCLYGGLPHCCGPCPPAGHLHPRACSPLSSSCGYVTCVQEALNSSSLQSCFDVLDGKSCEWRTNSAQAGAARAAAPLDTSRKAPMLMHALSQPPRTCHPCRPLRVQVHRRQGACLQGEQGPAGSNLGWVPAQLPNRTAARCTRAAALLTLSRMLCALCDITGR